MRSIFRSGRGIDERGVLERPPFRSIYFVITSAMGMGCVVLDGYILERHWRYLSTASVVALIALVSLQVVYEAVGLLRLIPLIREFYSIASERNLAPDSPLGDAIGAAVSGFADKLFFSYGITLGLLGVVAKLLSLRHPI